MILQLGLTAPRRNFRSRGAANKKAGMITISTPLLPDTEHFFDLILR
jgi:hypothetical protein